MSENGPFQARETAIRRNWLFRWQGNTRPRLKHGGNDMPTGTVRINLRYERADLETISQYAKRNGVWKDGRYDTQTSLLNIWTHHWSNPGCQAESTLMFSLDFDWNTASLMSVVLRPRFDWQVFLDELGRLETAALGDVVYGKNQCESRR
jgi:hypothetical protein